MSSFKFVKLYKYEHWKQDYALPHKHNSYELSVYEKGKGMTMIEKNTYEYFDHSCVIVQPGVLHDDYAIEEQVVFCLQFMTDIKLNSSVILLNKANEKIIFQIEEILRNIYQQRDDLRFGMTECQLEAIILLLMRLLDINNMRHVYQNAVVDYIKKYLSNYIDTKINFEILSEKIGYSYERIRKIFKEVEGVSLYQYLLNLRLSKAKKLLYDQNKKIAAIAAECGFGSPIRFNLFFHEKMDMTPRQYRKIVHQSFRHDVFRKS